MVALTKDGEVWWHVDSQGRRIGYMWPEDFHAIIESIWGHRKGIRHFARYAGFNISTVEGYCNGKKPIPQYLALLAMYIQRDVIARHRPRPERHTLVYKRLVELDPEWLPGFHSKGVNPNPYA